MVVAGILALWAAVFLWEIFSLPGVLSPSAGKIGIMNHAAMLSSFTTFASVVIIVALWKLSRWHHADRTTDESFHEAFIKTTPSFFVAIDTNGKTLMMNDAMLNTLGYSREEVIGKDYLPLLIPERERLDVSQVFQNLMSTGGPLDAEYHVRTKDGRDVLVRWHGTSFYREDGKPVFFCGSGIDITEYKKAQEALAVSERRYRLYAENVRDVLWVLDNDLRYVYISPSVELLRGYPAGEALNLPMEKVFTPDSCRKVIRATSDIKARLARGETFDPRATIKLELEQYRKDGSTCWTEVIANLLRDDAGRQVGFLGITRDITDRKQAQESLRLSEERYRTIFETTGNATVIIREDTTISLANGEFEKLSGYSREEVEGKKSWMDFVVDEDMERMTRYHAARRQDPEKAPRNYDFRFRDRHGRVRTVSANATLVPGTTMSVVSLLDITERIQTEEHLRLSRERLRNLHMHTQELREQERANVAREIHDELGQVLTALKMDLSYLTRRLPQGHEALQKKAATMIRSIDTSIDTVRRIIMDLRPGLLDHLGLVPALEWQTEEFQKRTGIVCSATFPCQEIVLDRDVSTTIFRIFQEALTNITRHASATRVDISLSVQGNMLRLCIHDNGVGITKNQIDNPRSFGLMGMRERALFCNGTLEIFSVESGGTKVVVEIPLADARKADDTGTGGR